MHKTETFTLLAGTVCKRNGIPFELADDTKILCHPANIELITESLQLGAGESGRASSTADLNQTAMERAGINTALEVIAFEASLKAAKFAVFRARRPEAPCKDGGAQPQGCTESDLGGHL